MRIGSLCSGYGGLELGVTAVLGGEVVWHAEIDRAASRVLAYRWPGVPNHGDITITDWTRVEPVDLLTAGFPCQTVSLSGTQGGLLAAADDSGLWATRAPWEGVVDALAVLRPRLVVLENVRGLLNAPVGRGVETVGGAFGRVLGDLASLGFDAEWVCFPASDVGAPHRRTRVFVAATHTRGEAVALRPGLGSSPAGGVGWGRPDHDALPADADPDGDRREGLPPGDGAHRGVDVEHGYDADGCGVVDWLGYAAAVHRWERIVARRAPAPIVLGPNGGSQLNPRCVEWMMGLPAGHVTDVPGISRRAALRLLGNGVVPQQAAHALTVLVDALALEAA